MLLEKEITEKLCPSYQKAVQELNEKYAAISDENYVAKLKVFKEFFHSYLMVPQLWDKFFNIYTEYKESIGCTSEEILFFFKTNKEMSHDNEISHYQFYDKKSPTCKVRTLINTSSSLVSPLIPKYIRRPYTLKEIERMFIRPQIDLDDIFAFFNQNSQDPITEELFKKFRKSKKLYEEIFKAENDEIKWFNLLTECKDDDFVCDNIDNRLGKELNNLTIWKLYFDYLKKIKNYKV